MKKIISFLFISAILTSSVYCQTAKSAAKLALETEINTLKKDVGLKNASWSVYVQNITSGEVEADYNSNMSLLPASILKTVTTTTALALLGSNYKFETRLQYNGTIDSISGILHGNLYLSGGGDPTLGSKRFGSSFSTDSVFAEFSRVLLKKNIKTIDGYLIADESIFDDLVPQSWGWEDIGNYYGSGTCGLSVYENMYRLYFDAGNFVGDSVKLTGIDPPMPGITFINTLTTGKAGTGDNVFILGGPYTYIRVLDGTVPVGKTHFDVDGSIPDPAKFCVQLLSDKLTLTGITVSKGITTIREERWKGPSGINDTARRIDLARHLSPALSQIVYYTNLKSVNTFAETLLKMMGYKQKGEGTTKAGIEVINNYWLSKGIDLKGFDIYDGCGLSRKDKVTTQQICKILVSFYSNPAYKSFLESLPVAGKSGNLASYLKGTVAENNLKAKTGTMDGVRSFAGYVTNTKDEDLAFVIIMNNFTCEVWDIKKKCEHLMQLISELD
jgi:serine-type D-Ala-D-Ala carboxypeptidase/endopeptidase (penicillin-binding protein 4)